MLQFLFAISLFTILSVSPVTVMSQTNKYDEPFDLRYMASKMNLGS